MESRPERLASLWCAYHASILLEISVAYLIQAAFARAQYQTKSGSLDNA